MIGLWFGNRKRVGVVENWRVGVMEWKTVQVASCRLKILPII
jgi:hypothetical protein